MDVHLHGACMGKLVGPAGFGAGGGGTGIGTQFRILPNSMPSECYPIDSEKVPVATHRPGLHLRLSSPTQPHRNFNPEPLKIGDEYLPSGSSSPNQESIPAGFLLHDSARRPSLIHPSPDASVSPAKRIMDGKFVVNDDGDGVPNVVESESLMVSN